MPEKNPDTIPDPKDELTARILKAVENVKCCCGTDEYRRKTGDQNRETGREDEPA